MSSLWRLRLLAAVAIVCVQFLAVTIVPRAQSVNAQEGPKVEAVAGEFIVVLKPTSGANAFSAAQSYDGLPGVQVDHTFNSSFQGFSGSVGSHAAAKLSADPNVAAVFPNYTVHAFAEEVPLGVNRVDAELNLTKAGNGSGAVSIDVAVIDTGVSPHPDLTIAGGKDCSGTGYYSDDNGHGTHVAGTIGARDSGAGIVGVAPGARIWAVKVLDASGNGSWADVICGMDWVASRASTIKVANMSLGSYHPYDPSCSSTPFHTAFCNLTSRGVTTVVAAGNDSSNANAYVPAQYSQAITVSAYNDSDGMAGGLGDTYCYYYNGYSCTPEFDDELASFSNYGTAIDIAAPGVWIKSTSLFGGYIENSGTSMAAPHVAGGAALILAQQGSMSPSSVRARLLLTAEPGAIPGDFDGAKEPRLNVAYLGTGKIVAPSSAKVGDSIQVRVGDFTPGTRGIFRFNGTFIGGDTIDDGGRGHRNYVIPAMPAGTYKATVTNGLKTVTRNVRIESTIVLSPTSGPVDGSVNVTFRGFAKSEMVDVRINGRTVIDNKAMSSTGSGSQSFVLPAMPRGTYTVSAAGNQGNSASATFSVLPTGWLSSGNPEPAAAVTISYRGFKVGEEIKLRYGAQDGEVINTASEVASSTGSGSDTATIPADAGNGPTYIWIMGDLGTEFRVALSVSGAEEPTPTPPATAEPTATSMPTEVPTEFPTEAPTETPSEAPTETATETPVEVPTETLTGASTETAIAES